MWAWDPSKDGQPRGRKEAELARYFKLEYGEAEVDRLLTQARSERPPSPGRFWSGRRRRAVTRRPNGGGGSRPPGHKAEARPRVAVAPASHPSGGPPKAPLAEERPVACRHVEWETLGSGGSTTYLRCKACGALVVSQGDRLWSFGRPRPQGI